MTGLNTLRGSLIDVINHIIATSQFQAYRIYLSQQQYGYKVLIMGNHDRRKSITYWKNVGFDEVSKHPILVEDKYLLSHEPRYELAGKGLYYNIHGHIHHLDINSDDKDIYFNVCVEKNNYKPWDFEVIKKRLEVKN